MGSSGADVAIELLDRHRQTLARRTGFQKEKQYPASAQCRRAPPNGVAPISRLISQAVRRNLHFNDFNMNLPLMSSRSDSRMKCGDIRKIEFEPGHEFS
jgi:hypothetical protein